MHDPQDVHRVRTAGMLIDEHVGMNHHYPGVVTKSWSWRTATGKFRDAVDGCPELAIPAIGRGCAGNRCEVSNDPKEVVSAFGRDDNLRHRAPMNFR